MIGGKPFREVTGHCLPDDYHGSPLADASCEEADWHRLSLSFKSTVAGCSCLQADSPCLQTGQTVERCLKVVCIVGLGKLKGSPIEIRKWVGLKDLRAESRLDILVPSFVTHH